MKKALLSLLLIISMVAILAGCSTGTTDNTASEVNPEDIKEPVSDVSGGTGIQGTWKCERDADGVTETLVIALNSDNKFEFYSDSSSEGMFGVSGKALVDGTYKVDGDKVELTYSESEESGADVELNDSMSSFTYKLDGNTLDVTFPNNEHYSFTRQ